ncbi:MAG: hypothetical protein Kow00124_02070 [Anaerolineae bacterium]
MHDGREQSLPGGDAPGDEKGMPNGPLRERLVRIYFAPSRAEDAPGPEKKNETPMSDMLPEDGPPGSVENSNAEGNSTAPTHWPQPTGPGPAEDDITRPHDTTPPPIAAEAADEAGLPTTEQPPAEDEEAPDWFVIGPTEAPPSQPAGVVPAPPPSQRGSESVESGGAPLDRVGTFPPVPGEVIVQPLIYEGETPAPPEKPQRTRQVGRLWQIVLLRIAMILIVIGGAVTAAAILSGPREEREFAAATTAAPAILRTPVRTVSLPTATPIQPTARPEETAAPRPTSEPETAQPGGAALMLGGVEMVFVPGGTFLMGDESRENSSPRHEVTLDAFYIDRTEVTNAQWRACVEAGACSPPADTRAYDGTPYYDDPAFDDYPVIYVSWAAADAYCRWRGARLPTEAEWEMAARWDPQTGAVTLYPWGDEWDPARANACDSSCMLLEAADPAADDGWPQTAPVGSFPDGASPLGVLDMAGNVAEWVADWYGAAYYSVSPAENPTGPESGTTRVVRGGAWGVSAAGVQSVLRSRFEPGLTAPGIGLRCAVSAEDVTP